VDINKLSYLLKVVLMHLHTYLPPITDLSEQLIDLFQPPMLQVAFTRMRKVLKITLNRQ